MAKAVTLKDGIPQTQCPICGRCYPVDLTDVDATPCPECDPQ